jgi:hypothetical protein
MEQIDRLLLAHRDPSCVCRVGDYLMLVLYEALECWTALHNDSVDERHPAARVGRFRVGRVDLGSILDSSFPDLDSLMDELLDASADVKQAIGVRPETFAVVAGLKPHPSELDMVVEEPGTFRPAPGPRTGRVVESPPRRCEVVRPGAREGVRDQGVRGGMRATLARSAAGRHGRGDRAHGEVAVVEE